MTLRYTQQSNNYLTSKLESDQLFRENVRDCTLGPKLSSTGVPSELFPTTTTTGNGVVYLRGAANVDQALGGGDILLFLPEDQPTHQIITIPIVIIQSGTTPIVVGAQVTGNQVLPLTPTDFLVNTQVNFDSIIYLTRGL